jgi:hypothetical protein
LHAQSRKASRVERKRAPKSIARLELQREVALKIVRDRWIGEKN